MAAVTADFLAGTYTAFRALWQDAFLAADGEAMYPMLAMEVESTTLTESYSWLGTVPQMRQWVDARQHQGMNAFNYSLTNEHYEVTTDVDRDTFEDDRLGQIAPRISQLGQEAPRFMDFTAVLALNAGATAGNNSYDGVTFYNASHITGVNAAQTNLYAATGVGLAALQVDFGGAKAQMMRVKDDQGRVMNIKADTVLAPPEIEQTFSQLLNAAFVPLAGIGSGANTFSGQANLKISGYLTSTTAWHLLATKAAAAKPLILQLRKAPEFTGVDRPDAHMVYEFRKLSYGVDSRFKVGYGWWETAIKVA